MARTLTSVALALTVAAGPLIDAAPAFAGQLRSPDYFIRRNVIERALTWTSRGVPYSQSGWYRGYRMDCSGFVSMAWGLDQSYTTWSLPEVSRPIPKYQLQAGDILLGPGHVVIFGAWANAQKTRYWCYEQTPGRAVRHVVPYPFRVGGNYRPYRYVGSKNNLFAPGSKRTEPNIQSYAGGKPLVPAAAMKARAAQAKAEALRKARWEREAKAKWDKIAARKKAALAKSRAKAAAEAKTKARAKAAAAKAGGSTLRAGRADTPVQALLAADTAKASVGDEPVIVHILRGVVGWISR